MQLLLTGIVSIILGLSVLFRPVFYSSKYSMVMDYTDVKEPLSIIFLIYGFYAVLVYFKNRKTK